jgi:single-strand DNA-binding protein
MKHLNQVLLVGNLGDDPEVRTVGQKGSTMAKFTVATTESYTTKSGEQRDTPQWTRCVAWNGNAEGARALRKGDLVTVVGKLQTRKWDKNGVPTYTTEVVVDAVSKVHTKGRESQGSPAQSGPPQGGPPGNFSKGGWPFKDMSNDLSWPAPNEDGYSMVQQGAQWHCCAWYDPKDPERGGDMLILNSQGAWEKVGVVPELANKF